jgi:membrane protease YdiL (CAAX protease family)
LAVECVLVCIGLFAFIAVLQAVPTAGRLGRLVHALLPVAWIGVPWFLLSGRNESFQAFGLHLNDLARSLWTGIIVSLLVLVPYFILFSLWFGRPAETASDSFAIGKWLSMSLYQFVYIAFPEEFFFRGYLHNRLNQIFGIPRRLFGASVGAGLVITAGVFMLFHLLLSVNLWNAGIFFPALIFGWLRDRTGSIAAPTLFHALSNIALFTIQGNY